MEAFGWQNGIKSLLARVTFHYLRLWDYRTSNGIDKIIANSQFIAKRIRKVYGRQSTVIYPPVDIDTFDFCALKEDYYMTASFMNPFKKIDLIVKAFAKLPNQRLVVVGNGPEFKQIQDEATPNVELLGYQKTDRLKYYLQKAKAFIFAAPEDFGIIMAEAQACGTPVIAYGRGGATEIVRGLDQENPTGVLFSRQTIPSILQAINLFEQSCDLIHPQTCRENSLRFKPSLFRKSFQMTVREEWLKFQQ